MLKRSATHVEESQTSGSRFRWSLGITTAAVMLMHVAKDVGALPDAAFPSKLTVGVWGFLALLGVNIVLFSVTLLIATKQALEVGKENMSQEQKDERAEKIMIPALQAQTDPPELLSQIMKALTGVFLGLIAGSILAWPCSIILQWFGAADQEAVVEVLMMPLTKRCS